MKKVLVFVVVIILFAGAAVLFTKKESDPTPSDQPQESALPQSNETKRLEFATVDPIYRFSAIVPISWEAIAVPQIQAINISDQIFIRSFTANTFLTLSTVDIFDRQELTIAGHDTVRYDIQKKAGVPNFPNQPAWRNQRHFVTDIRFSATNPSIFYVFAVNPMADPVIVEEFFKSLIFHNDKQSFVAPLERIAERVTKKPFGIFVEEERFTGYHTGTDFEIFSGEQQQNITVSTICGGQLRSKELAGGYGGVVLQDCIRESQPLTVLYGHLRLQSIAHNNGDYLLPGQALGVLGTAYSTETDGERAHLHLGILKGTVTNLAGYVSQQSQLSPWINPVTILPGMVVPISGVPFVAQAPFGDWADQRQQDGCEEASALMAVRWAQGVTTISKDEALKEILAISDYEQATYGSYHDTNAQDTNERILKGYFNFQDAVVRSEIGVQDIKLALAQGSVVILPVNGQKLGNPNFSGAGPERHMLVIKAYDAGRDEFITNDPGTRKGENYRYKTSVMAGALREYPTGDHVPITDQTKTAMIVVSR